MNKFDTVINEELNEDWKDVTAAGLIGLGAMTGSQAKAEPSQPKPIEQPATKNSEEAMYAENILARTLWAEGRSEKDLDTALRAIATSIYNRTQAKIQAKKIQPGPLAYVKVVLTPYQYSAWNGWTTKNPTDYPDTKERSGKGWEESKKIAREIVNGTFKPIPAVGTSTHYFAPNRLNKSPSWATNKDSIKIGNHVFVKDKMAFPSPRLGDKA